MQIDKDNRYFVKMWEEKEAEEKEAEKKRVHERLQKVYDSIIDFYGEEMINEIILFYQNLRSDNIIRDFSDEEVDME
jgi:hypothetical protein